MGLFSGYRDAHHLKWREAAEYYRTIHVYNLSTVGVSYRIYGSG